MGTSNLLAKHEGGVAMGGGAARVARAVTKSCKLVTRGLLGNRLNRFSGRGTTRTEDSQGTLSQSHISPSILVYEDKYVCRFAPPGGAVCVGDFASAVALAARKVDIRLPGKENSNSHGAGPVY